MAFQQGNIENMVNLGGFKKHEPIGHWANMFGDLERSIETLG